MKLTMEEQAYFDKMNNLFMSEGWRLFLDDVKGFHEAMEGAFDGVKDLRELGVAQGRKMTFVQILAYQEMIEASQKSLEDAPEPEVELHVSDV